MPVRYYVVPTLFWVLRVLWVLYSTHGYCGYYGTIGYYGYYGTTNGYYIVPMGTMYVVPMGTMYVVPQAYAAEGMNKVRFRVRLRVCTPHARYLTFLRVILIKMARAFAESVIISIIGLERCEFKQNPVRVRVRVCIWDRVRVSVN